MVHDPALLDALEREGAAPLKCEVWRHMFNGADPARPNTRGARWNPSGVAAVYLSLQRETALAEAEFSMAAQPVRPQPKSRELHRIAVTLQAVGDLRDVATLGSMGVGATELGRWPPTECQRVGGAAAWLQWDGLLVPSARADGLNLVVFPDHMNPDALLEVIDSIIL